MKFDIPNQTKISNNVFVTKTSRKHTKTEDSDNSNSSINSTDFEPKTVHKSKTVKKFKPVQKPETMTTMSLSINEIDLEIDEIEPQTPTIPVTNSNERLKKINSLTNEKIGETSQKPSSSFVDDLKEILKLFNPQKLIKSLAVIRTLSTNLQNSKLDTYQKFKLAIDALPQIMEILS
ncbi:hypothetical protein NPIL_606711 [Nephila pilipes]|uniref:Uncharacterized protein n=1 Tax=Nephila pilipes TaxID=299642 RepID=A0A8X6NI82_NEPPI|nr:hypothetical protein NPIL_606711 [Nephila pilipes]